MSAITVTTDNPSGTPGYLRLNESARLPRGVFFKASHGTASALGHLDASAARDLGAWLVKRYGLQGWVPNVGDMVRVLDGAEGADNDDLPAGIRKAKVISGIDSDGDMAIEVTEADDRAVVGELWYVLPRFLAHSDAILPEDAKPKPTPAPRLAVGTPAVIVTDDAQGNHGSRAHLPKGTPVVINGDMPSGSYRVTAHIDGSLKTRYVRTTDVALSLPAEEPAAQALEVGKVYRLLPDSKYAQGSPTYFKPSVTRVKLLTTVLSDGNVRADAIDGTPGDKWHLDPKYLAPITEAAWAVGDEAIVTRDKPQSAEFYTGDRVRIVSVEDATALGAKFVAGRGSDTPAYRPLTWYVESSDIRRP